MVLIICHKIVRLLYGQKRKSGGTINKGVLCLGKNGKFYKWRDTNNERGGEGIIENLNLQSFQVALRLLSPCSQVA